MVGLSESAVAPSLMKAAGTPYAARRAMLGHRSTLLRRIVLGTRGDWLAFLAGNTPPEPPERISLFCDICRAATPHNAFEDSGFVSNAQMKRCRRGGRDSLKGWP